jgi:hypothetical protein
LTAVIIALELGQRIGHSIHLLKSAPDPFDFPPLISPARGKCLRPFSFPFFASLLFLVSADATDLRTK